MSPLPEISHRAHKDHREGQFKFYEPSEASYLLVYGRSLVVGVGPGDRTGAVQKSKLDN